MALNQLLRSNLFCLSLAFACLLGCAVDNQIQGDFLSNQPNPGQDPVTAPVYPVGQMQLLSAGGIDVQTPGGYILNVSLGGKGNSQQTTGGGYKIDLTIVGNVQ